MHLIADGQRGFLLELMLSKLRMVCPTKVQVRARVDHETLSAFSIIFFRVLGSAAKVEVERDLLPPSKSTQAENPTVMQQQQQMVYLLPACMFRGERSAMG